MEPKNLPSRVPRKRPREDETHRSQGDNLTFARKQARTNQEQESEQMRVWVSQEDEFVLKQANKAAIIRVKEGRAKPIDWLAVTLQLVEPLDPLEDDDLQDIEFMNPEGVFDELDDTKLIELGKNIKAFKELEKNRDHRDFWETMNVICKDRREKLQGPLPADRAVNSVSADVDKLLGKKSYEGLVALEAQIRSKLRSDEPIDVDYWEHLLRGLIVYKARAKLQSIFAALNSGRVISLRKQQQDEANDVRKRLESILSRTAVGDGNVQGASIQSGTVVATHDGKPYDPEPALRLSAEDKHLDLLDEHDFLKKISADRVRNLKLGYIPIKSHRAEKSSSDGKVKSPTTQVASRFAAVPSEDFSHATKALYEREVARGINEDEEIFTGEEDIANMTQPKWADKHRPRKPKYFNRVQMGYEWNKYNQTHYDHDNPPPKVVQGYKFNIFYPDLIEKSKAPTYRIERENGRRKGQSFAPAGEEDTCLIKFISGPPYEDIAFRIVDKEWDYSAKRDRGFKSSFDKGILQLHFQFKKIYYRK